MSNQNQTLNDSFPELFDLDAQDALAGKLSDAMTPGFVAECDPAEAERAGAFVEDAMSLDDAIASSIDLGAVMGN